MATSNLDPHQKQNLRGWQVQGEALSDYEEEGAHREPSTRNNRPFIRGVRFIVIVLVFSSLFFCTNIIWPFTSIYSSTKTATPSPAITSTPMITPSPTIAPTLTPKPFALPEYDLRSTAIHTSANSLFWFTLPADWKLNRTEQSGNGNIITLEVFAPKDNLNLYWQISVELMEAKEYSGYSLQKLAPVVKNYVSNTYATFPELRVEKPHSSENTNAIQVSWTCTFETPYGQPVPMRGLTVMRRHGDRLSVITIYLPHEQFDRQNNAVFAIINSLEVSSPLILIE